MMEFGKSLRNAREAKGYSIAQLAEITRLAPNTITDLENEDVQRIAAPIYGRGFVRLYCEAVGLESKPFIAEFMEIMNGNREPVIRERQPVASAEPEQSKPVPPEKEPEAGPEGEESGIIESSNLEPASEDLLSPQPPPQRDAFRVPPAPSQPIEATEPAPSLSRYASPLRTMIRTTSSSAAWRIGVLAIAAVALIVLLAFGIRALRKATAPSVTETSQASVSETPAKASADKKPDEKAVAEKPSAPREQQAIPAMYID